MRRAGYEVRVLPEEASRLGGKSADAARIHPPRPALVPGQYAVLAVPDAAGTEAVSRYQLAFAILMFLGSPAWMALLVLGTSRSRGRSPVAFLRRTPGSRCSILALIMWFAPKIATVDRRAAAADARAAFGGGARFLVERRQRDGVLPDAVADHVVRPHAVPGRACCSAAHVGWGGQARDDHAVPWRCGAPALAADRCSAGLAFVALALTVPAAIPYALLIAGGLALAIPLAVFTADPPSAGRAAARRHRPAARGNRAAAARRTRPAGARGPQARRAEASAASERMLDRVRAARGVLRSLRIYYGDAHRRAAHGPLYAAS